MGLPKGRTNNVHGRTKGSRNKFTANIRNSISAFMDASWEDVQKEFQQLEGKDKLMFFERLLPYLAPKMSAIALDASVDVEVKSKMDALSSDQLVMLIDKIIADEK